MKPTRKNRLGTLLVAVTALVLIPAGMASATTKATATGKLVDKVPPATQAECEGTALAIDLAGKQAKLLAGIGNDWGCKFETTGGGSTGSAQRTVGQAGGYTMYGQRAASQAECDAFAAAIDIVSELVYDPKNAQYALLLGNVLTGIVSIGQAMGCAFTSTA